MTTVPDYKKVTAILPNYNYAKYVSSRIEEVLSQTYPVSEIIILDDASNDKSLEEIEKKVSEIRANYPEITVRTEYNKKNSGSVFSQWAKGINLASYDYIWICEMDDSVKPNFLEKIMLSFFDQDVVLAYSNSKLVNQNGKPLIKENLRKIKDFFRRKHFFGSYTTSGIREINRNLAVYNAIPNISAVVLKNRSVLDDYLKEAKKYRLSGDWYFYLNVLRDGKIHYCSRKLNIHRIHEKSVTSKTSLKERFMEMKEIHQYADKSFDLSSQTKRRIAKLEKDLARKWE